MKRKFALIIAIILCLALMLAGCGKSVAERAAEALIKNATGTDVDVNGDKVEIKGSSGETVTVGGNIAWPKDKMGDLPELSGTIQSSFENGDAGIVLTCVGISKSDAEAYIRSLKDRGYTEDAYEANADSMIQYSANNGSHTVSFTFYSDGGDSAGESSCALSYVKMD